MVPFRLPPSDQSPKRKHNYLVGYSRNDLLVTRYGDEGSLEILKPSVKSILKTILNWL